MGYDFDNSKVLKICVIGGSEEIINKIFPNNLGIQKDIQCKKRNLYKDIEAKDYDTGKSAKYKVNWEAYIFPNLTDDNEESIMDTISYKIFNFPNKEQNIQNNQQNISKNNIIIKFGSNNTDFLLEYIDFFFSKLFIPQIAIITNEEIKGNQNNRFLTVIKEKMHSELYKDIFSYLWERECYFNQRGHLMSEYAPKSHDKIKDLPCSSLNILLTGISRSGKSTFINTLSKKLISLETPECLSVTREINEFVIYKEVEGQGTIKFKLIDTPGLTIIPEENKDTTDDVINSIDKKLKEFDDSNDSIHIIYFFMIGVTNLEQSKKFFKYLSDLQKERVKKNIPKLPILFIFNRICDEENFDALKKFLFENDFGNLYEEREKTEIKGISSKEKMKLKKNKNLNNVDNILGINLLNKYDNGKIVSNAFGMPDLLRATKYFIKKLNPFKKEDFNNVENYIKEFKKYNSNNKLTEEENKKYLLLKEDCKNLIIQISMDNSLLYKLKNKDEIIEKAKKEADKIIYISSGFGFGAGLIPVPFVDIPILYSINLSMILKIGKCFSVEFNEIPNGDRVLLVMGFEANVQSTAKVVGNKLAAESGEELGKNLVKDLGNEGTHQVVELARKGIGISEVGEVAEYLELPDKNSYQKLTNYLYNLFPSFETSVQNGIENGGQEIGKRVKRVIERNSYNLAEDFLEEASEKYSKELALNASSYFYEFFPKVIPVIGSLIGGISDAYSTYKAGKNCIKYFEEYINKTQGCEFVLKRKEEYEKILNSLDILANDNFDDFGINIFN